MMSSTDTNVLFNLLTSLLIVMIFILIVLSVIYLVLKLKQKSRNSKNKEPKEKIEMKTTASKKTNGYSKQSIFDFMEFDDIQDNMIIQKDGKRFLMVIECQGVNYDLMSQMEKVGVEEGFQQFLNTLRHPIQLYIQTRTVNLEKSISMYRQQVKEIEDKLNNMQFEYNRMIESESYSKGQLDKYFYEMTKQKNLYEYAKDIVYNTEKMSLNKNVLNKHYYIIIPYYSEEVGDEKYSKEEINNMAFSELYTKSQAIIRTLSACSVSGRILTSNELVELLYVAYNRDESEVFGIEKALKSGYDELYSTSKDVFAKKIQVLDKNIEDKAIDLANEKIRKVKSKMQEQAEEKENNMDELINNLAKALLEENKDYVGQEIAQEAINEIEEDKEGGKIDVQEKKSKRGRKKKSE